MALSVSYLRITYAHYRRAVFFRGVQFSRISRIWGQIPKIKIAKLMGGWWVWSFTERTRAQRIQID